MGPLDEAELRAEMRAMYRDIGFAESLICLYSILQSGVILCEIIDEEQKREKAKGLEPS